MKRLTLTLVLAALVACFALPGPALAEHADLVRAAKKFKQMVEEGRTENLMTRVELYSLAGLSYQNSLTVPMENLLSCKNQEQKRILAGMIRFDMNYAMTFGQARTALDTERFYREELLPDMEVAEKLELSPANANLFKQLLEDPNNPEIRSRIIQQTTRNAITTAGLASDDAVMEFIVDSFYGNLIQGLYVACTLAQHEQITPEIAELFMGQLERFSLFDELFHEFEDEACMQLMNVLDRDGLLHTVMDMIKKTDGRLTQENIDTLLALVTPRRAALITPCK